MDNVTHTLIGITLGRTVSRKNTPFQKAAIWTAVLGNNLPDLDFLFKPFVISGNLGYLLHHRGYTHTILGSFFLGGVAALLGSKISREKETLNWKLFLLGWVSVLLHILADYCNNYGVHPFSPFWNQWFYGDFLFILEPLIWLCVLPLVFFTSKGIVGKIIPLILGIVLLCVVWTQVFTPVPIQIRLALSFWAFAFIRLNKKFRSVLPSIVGIIIVLTAFQFGKRSAKTRLESLLRANSPESTIHRIATTPAPGNPFCWSVISLGTEKNSDYVARLGVFSLLPTVFEPQTCYLKTEAGIANLQPASLSYNPHFHWAGEFRKPMQEFTYLKSTSCRFRAFLKFARIPIWQKTGDTWVAGDLRYDRKNQKFATVDLSSKLECPDYPPPWDPPTQ